MDGESIAELRIRFWRDGNRWRYRGIYTLVGETQGEWQRLFAGRLDGVRNDARDPQRLAWSLLCSMQTMLSAWARVRGVKL